jgi:hypothetical protein
LILIRLSFDAPFVEYSFKSLEHQTVIVKRRSRLQAEETGVF